MPSVTTAMKQLSCNALDNITRTNSQTGLTATDEETGAAQEELDSREAMYGPDGCPCATCKGA